MKLRIEVVAIDCLMVRLFDAIEESTCSGCCGDGAAARALRHASGGNWCRPTTTLMVHYDLLTLNPQQARDLIHLALDNLAPDPSVSGQHHVLPAWYDPASGRN